MNWSSWTWKGLIVFALVVALAALALFLVALPEAGVDTTPTSSDGPNVTAPASPGLTAAVDICKYGSANVSDDPHSGKRYHIQFGLEVLEYVRDEDDANKIALVNGEPVTLSDEVLNCVRGKK